MCTYICVYMHLSIYIGFPCGLDSKESTCNARDLGLILVGKIPWRRKRQPTPVFMPGEFHGQSSLVGYSPWGCKESDVTEQLTHTHTHTHTHTRMKYGRPWLITSCLDSTFL